MHTFIKHVNGYTIRHWTLVDVFYIQEGEKWIVEDKDLDAVIDFAMKR